MEMSELFANEMSEHTVTVRGVRLRILDSGEPQHPDNAPALLFLHGLRKQVCACVRPRVSMRGQHKVWSVM